MGATAIELGLPIVGICRGAQLGCALAGGILVQHVENHCETHLIATKDGRRLITSSLHHQMLFPWYVEHELIAWASPSRSQMYVGLTDEEEGDLPAFEPEIVWFPKIKCLAVQGHPEFMDPKCAFNTYVHELINGYIFH